METGASGILRPEVLVFGGGVAGLWALDELRRAGYDALLLEADGLGRGQSIVSQGIVHGGGKYALRGVQDVEAVRAIREMPTRWRDHLEGRRLPDLSAATLLSPRCHLWLPRGSWTARLESWGLMRVVTGAGLLATRPVAIPREEWPEALRASALRVYAMAEPVLATGSLLEALAAPHAPRVRSYEGRTLRIEDDGRRVRLRCGSRDVTLEPGAIVCAAGEGNAELLRQAGGDPGTMQRRPLRMAMLRGSLPPLFAHCVMGGKTRLTVTSFDLEGGERVWQLGGELAERHAGDPDGERIAAALAHELGRCLPGLPREGLRMASYACTRAEGRHRSHRRPSGVQLRRVADRGLVAWPTKLALAPLLAEEIAVETRAMLGPARGGDEGTRLSEAPPARRAPYPWEEALWQPVV